MLCYCIHTLVIAEPVTWIPSPASLLPPGSFSFQAVAVMPLKCIIKSISFPTLEHSWSHCLNKTIRTLTPHYILGARLWREWGSKAKFCLFPNFHRHLDTASVLCPTGEEEMRNTWKQWPSCGPNPSHWHQGSSETDFCNNELWQMRPAQSCEISWQQRCSFSLIPYCPCYGAVFCLLNSSVTPKISLQNYWNLLGTGNTLLLYHLGLCLLQSPKKDKSEECSKHRVWHKCFDCWVTLLGYLTIYFATTVCQDFMDDFPFAFSNHFPLQPFASVFPVEKWTWHYLFNKRR